MQNLKKLSFFKNLSVKSKLGVCAAEENETDAKKFDLSGRVRINDLDLEKG